MRRTLFILIMVGVFFFIYPLITNQILAVSCNSLLSSDSTIESDCTFDGTIDGYDDGTGDTNTTALIIDRGGGSECPDGVATLTISVNQTIAVGSITIACGAIAISTETGTQKLAIQSPLWMIDSDGDGYPVSTTVYAQEATPSGGVRKSSLTALTIDCCDTNARVYPESTTYRTNAIAPTGTYYDSGCTKDTTYDYNCDDAITQQYTTTYSCVTSGCATHFYTVTTGWNGSTPACGASGTYYTATNPASCASTIACESSSASVTQSCR